MQRDHEGVSHQATEAGCASREGTVCNSGAPRFQRGTGGIPGTPSVDGAGPLPYSFFWFLKKSKSIGGAGRPACTPAQGCIGGTPLRCHVRYRQEIVSISARPDPGFWRLSTEMYWKRRLFAEGAGSSPSPLTLDSLSRRETRHGLSSKVPSKKVPSKTIEPKYRHKYYVNTLVPRIPASDLWRCDAQPNLGRGEN